MIHRARLSFLLVVLLVAGAGCAGSRGATDPTESPDELPQPAIDHSEYETFDASPYPDEPPTIERDVEHDVPVALLEGRAAAGYTETIRGFRLQAFQTMEKSEAVGVEEEIKAWWRAQEEAGAAPNFFIGGDPPLYTIYSQPYYRVRLGDFATREAAEQALQFFRQRFPEMFVVPDTVTVTR